MKKIFYVILFTFLISTSAFAAVETAESVYAKAYAYIYKNSPKTAISHFKNGLNTYPDCAFLHAGLGDAYLKEGNYQKAMDEYIIAQKSKYAIDMYKLDFYNASIKKNMQIINNSLAEIIAATKYSDDIILFGNINKIMNEDYEKTEFITELYTETDSEYQKIDISTIRNKDAEVKKYLALLSSNPHDSSAANNAGALFIYLKDYQLAEKYLKQALENKQNSPEILNNLGVVNIYQNNFNEADNYFNMALKEKSDYVPALNNRAVAKIYAGLTQYQAGNVNVILDIAKKDNDNIYAWRILSLIYFLKGDYKNANNLLTHLDSTYNFKLYEQKAFMAFKNKNYTNALTYIEKAISLYSGNANDYILKGRILAETDDYVMAKSNLRQSLNRDNKNKKVNYYLAKTLYKSGEKVSAETAMKDFITSYKGNAETPNISVLFE